MKLKTMTKTQRQTLEDLVVAKVLDSFHKYEFMEECLRYGRIGFNQMSDACFLIDCAQIWLDQEQIDTVLDKVPA